MLEGKGFRVRVSPEKPTSSNVPQWVTFFEQPDCSIPPPNHEEVVTEVGAMEEVMPSGTGIDESEEDEAQQDSPISQARLKRLREESEESITLRHGEIVAALPPTFKSAGIIPYNKDGFWLGLERRKGAHNTWSDFGGKPKALENAWETAFRECKEEGGIDLCDILLRRPPIFHPDSATQSVIFWVETDAVPVEGAHPNMVEYRQFQSWPEQLGGRLKYDNGSLLKQEMVKLGFGNSKHKRCKSSEQKRQIASARQIEGRRFCLAKGQQDTNGVNTGTSDPDRPEQL